MITKKQLLDALAVIAPETGAEPWDNGGIQIFTGNDSVTTVLTALDVTEEVISEAVQKQADWIVTHHPLFFEAIKNLSHDNLTGRSAMQLIRHQISVYAAHTSFDNAPGGNNAYLASRLGLGLEREKGTDELPAFLYISKPLKQTIPFQILCERVQSALCIKRDLAFTFTPTKPVRKIAICTGSGADCIIPAQNAGCDVLITGDLKYHSALSASQTGFCVIDAGHYDTEKTFSVNMADQLQTILGEKVLVIPSSVSYDPYRLFPEKTDSDS